MTTSEVINQIHRRAPEFGDDAEAEIWGLLGAVIGDEAVEVVRRTALLSLLRTLELALLSEPGFLEVARYPDSNRGRAHRIVRQRLEAIGGGVGIDDATVQHFVDCLLSDVVNVTQKPSVNLHQRRAIELCLEKGEGRLRCETCGYHFVEADMGAPRRQIVEDFSGVLAEQRLAGRLSDPWKNPAETGLEIDHIIPYAGWGAATEENVQVLCKFCNLGKLINRWGGEVAMSILASSLALFIGDDTTLRWGVRRALYAVIAEGQVCMSCGGGPTTRELTAVRRDGSREPGSVALWTLQVVCYGCLG